MYIQKFSVDRNKLTIEYEDINGFIEKIIFFETLFDLEQYLVTVDKKFIKKVKIY